MPRRDASTRCRPACVGRDSPWTKVTVLQCAGSGLNANPHFHTLALDGVFRETDAGALETVSLIWNRALVKLVKDFATVITHLCGLLSSGIGTRRSGLISPLP